MARRPTSSRARGRLRPRSTVAARLSGPKAGQGSRPGSPQHKHRQAVRSIATAQQGLKALGIAPCADPRNRDPAQSGAGAMTTAEDFDDFIVDGPVAPPDDDDIDDPVEFKP